MWDVQQEVKNGYEHELPVRQSAARDKDRRSISNIYISSLPKDLRKIKHKEDEDVEEVFHELIHSTKSSEEILPPEKAIKYVGTLMGLMASGYDELDLASLRNELFRLYWNGLRNGKRKGIFTACRVIGEKREELLKKRFSGDFFRENWAHALVAIKNSPYCQGRVEKWEATFDWFIKQDVYCMRAVEGQYRDRKYAEKVESQRRRARATRAARDGEIIRNVSGKQYLAGVPFGSVQDFQIEDWVKANPDAAAAARESGVLDMRLNNRTEAG
jgi:hypothetical protein